MDIYGSFLGEEDAPPKQHVLRETREEGHSDSSLSMYAAMEGSRAAPPTVEESFDAAAFAASPQEEERAAATLAHSPDERQTPSSRKPNFAVLNNYRWGTYGAGDALLSESCVSPLLEGAADQEVECMLDGEDDIVLLADVPDLYLPVLERPEGWELGLGIYRFANETTKKAGDIMYYAANSVSDTGTKLLIEAKAKLSSSSDMAIVSVAGGAAAETFMFAIDRSRLLGHQLVNSLQGDPEMSRRLHLRRLLASGSWADFSAKCQLATLPWYDRQLIHLTRYDKINSAEPAKFSRAKALENNGPSATNAKKDSDLKPFKSNAYATSSHYSQNAVSKRKSGHNFDDGIIDDPTQLDTLIISDDEVHILNDLSRQTASDALDLKEESVVLSDSEFHQWILSRAKGGSADAAYALSKWFTPPSFTESSSCNKCQKDFGISRFRHHCRHCGKSFCSDHSSDLRTILKYGFLSPVRVCYYCACIIDKESRMDRQRWKKERLEDYSNKCMIPYFEIAEDRGVDKAFRLGLGTLHVVRNMGMALTYPALVAAESLEILRKYGLVGLAGILLRNDFMEAVEALKQITSMDERYPLSIRQLTACIYYKLAIERGIRGCDPDGELRSHVACPDGRWKQIAGQSDHSSCSAFYIKAQEEVDRHCSRLCKEVDDVILNEFLRYSSIALLIAYEENSVECQRLAELQGFQTLLSDPSSEPEKPAYAIFVCDGSPQAESLSGQPRPQRKREAVLAIRGTHTIQDVVTDLRAIPIVFPPSKTEIDGIMNGTVWVREKNLNDLATSCGNVNVSSTDNNAKNSGMKVYAEEVYITEEVGWHAPIADVEYACRGPARAALNVLAEVGPTLISLAENGHEIKIVGHSLGGAVASLLALLLREYIPAVKALAFSPPCFLSVGLAEKMEQNVYSCVLHDDIICRVSPESIRLLMKELIVFRDKVFKFVEQDWYDAIKRAGSIWAPRWRDSRSFIPSTNKNKYTSPMQKTKYTSRAGIVRTSDDITGVIGTVVVGEDDTVLVRQGKPVNPNHKDHQRVQLNALQYIADNNGVNSVINNENGSNSLPKKIFGSSDEEEEDIFFNEDDGADRAVIIGDTVVAKLHLPGRVFHIYPHRGVYRISEVPRSFPSLNRIEIQGDIFNDHRSNSVYDALLEVRSVRASKCPPPPWTPYDASAVCQRCKSSFTWHTTCQGDAQELRERYNCVCCGALVCGPCSTHMLLIPRLGLHKPTRVCDSCFHLGHHTSPTNPNT